jgi:hypothetical protein
LRFIFAVVVPLVLQVIFALGVITSTNGTGSFVGLGAMLLGLIAIPATAIHNWAVSNPASERSAGRRFNRVVLVTLIFPILLVILLLVAS